LITCARWKLTTAGSLNNESSPENINLKAENADQNLTRMVFEN